MKVSKQVNVDL